MRWEGVKEGEGSRLGEGLEAKQQFLLYPQGMLSEGRGGSVGDLYLSWKMDK